MDRFTQLGIVLVAVLLAGCAMPPKSFLKTYDEPGVWKTVDIRQDLDKGKAWRDLVDTLSQKYDLEVLEKESGYLRTSWKYTYVRGGEISSRYRSRIVVKLLGDPWDKVQVKCESNWLEDQGWIMGYDIRLLEDVYGDIQGKLGRVRR